jgi:hypothetical protein
MKGLGPQAQALIDAARESEVEGPTAEDRARVQARLAAVLGATAFTAVASQAAAMTAAGGGAAASGAGAASSGAAGSVAAASGASAANGAAAASGLGAGAASGTGAASGVSAVGGVAAANGFGAASGLGAAANGATAASGLGAAASGAGAASAAAAVGGAASGWVAAIGAKGAAWIGAAALSAAVGTTAVVTTSDEVERRARTSEVSRAAVPGRAAAASPALHGSVEGVAAVPPSVESTGAPGHAVVEPAVTVAPAAAERSVAVVESSKGELAALPARVRAHRQPRSAQTHAVSPSTDSARSAPAIGEAAPSSTPASNAAQAAAATAMTAEPTAAAIAPAAPSGSFAAREDTDDEDVAGPTPLTAAAVPVSQARNTASQRPATSAPSLDPTATTPSRMQLGAAQPQAAAALSSELELLAQAQRALHDGKLSLALSLLDRHSTRHAQGALQEERLAARAVVLCRMHQVGAGNAEAERLRARTPRSPLLPWVRESCKR